MREIRKKERVMKGGERDRHRQRECESYKAAIMMATDAQCRQLGGK